ncbi:DNA binding domain-containing protein, excisionase family [Paraburkholderia phenazinium]|uniref:DNA binding domain-containing protein, excisionase family n=1 Tax=Paraburkholderia phenazinium TaxID=60549 RepID=A0A1G7YDS4_9BURK|nr:helix-turn-helix domain-containing protein [Paraburkholderia phenazinium]SDG94702.1 DNA binding domain-containing protein, excisionase family [Paraburkholderia phenazinium]
MPRARTTQETQPRDDLPVPEILGTTQAARFLGIKPTTLNRMVDEGRLAYEQVGTHRRFQRADLEAFKATYTRRRGPPSLNRKTLFASFTHPDAARLQALADQRETTVSALLREFGLEGLDRATT